MPTIREKPLEPGYEVAIVVSRFNEEITNNLLKGALKVLHAKGFTDKMITIVFVPGAVEIPITAQALTESGSYYGILALGAVIRGETSHYDYVCQQVSYGCQRVALHSQIPVIFGVLTTEDDAQAMARAGDNDDNKGAECALAMIEMISVLEQIG